MRRVGGRRDARQNMLGWLEWDGAVGCVCVFGGRIRESAWMSRVMFCYGCLQHATRRIQAQGLRRRHDRREGNG
jgi:hypothetical protein